MTRLAEQDKIPAAWQRGVTRRVVEAKERKFLKKCGKKRELWGIKLFRNF